jgi:hypothetical protein
MGWLTVCTGTTYRFAIKRLSVQDFALWADNGNIGFGCVGHWASVLGQSLLQRNNIHAPQDAS